jgi:hypothetical protein
VPSSRELSQRFLGLPPIGPVHGLALAGFGEQMAGMLSLGRGGPGFLAQQRGLFRRGVVPSPRGRQLGFQSLPLRHGLRRALPK